MPRKLQKGFIHKTEAKQETEDRKRPAEAESDKKKKADGGGTLHERGQNVRNVKWSPRRWLKTQKCQVEPQDAG